mgnify:FL=1
MNQPMDEPQKHTGQKKDGTVSVRKRRAVISVIIAALLLLTIPVLAWFSRQRSMETMTQINLPYALRIGAGNTQPIQQLELSNIDVSKKKYEDVVFCVYSQGANEKYYLQLAHTTNIGFQYTIYKASVQSDGEISYLGNKYSQDKELAGKYLNVDSDSKYATNQYHETTYGNYDKVQQSAEPLYWRSYEQETLPGEANANAPYVNYYILHISWDDTVQNNKETDMIYLMAG